MTDQTIYSKFTMPIHHIEQDSIHLQIQVNREDPEFSKLVDLAILEGSLASVLFGMNWYKGKGLPVEEGAGVITTIFLSEEDGQDVVHSCCALVKPKERMFAEIMAAVDDSVNMGSLKTLAETLPEELMEIYDIEIPPGIGIEWRGASRPSNEHESDLLEFKVEYDNRTQGDVIAEFVNKEVVID